MQIVKRDFAIFDVFPDPPKRVTVHLLTSWNSCEVMNSLPPSYDMLVTALEASPEIPKMEDLTEKIINAERKIKEKQKSKKEEQALATERYKAPQTDSRKCFYCGGSGHIK